MAFDPKSRYANVETLQFTTTGADGVERTIAYAGRRIIPSYKGEPALTEHRVTEGERLDNLTARYAGDPTLFWMLCDANGVLNPGELEEVGRVIRIMLARR